MKLLGGGSVINGATPSSSGSIRDVYKQEISWCAQLNYEM